MSKNLTLTKTIYVIPAPDGGITIGSDPRGGRGPLRCSGSDAFLRERTEQGMPLARIAREATEFFGVPISRSAVAGNRWRAKRREARA